MVELVCEREKLAEVLRGVCNVLPEPDVEFRADGVLIAQMIDKEALVALRIPKESFGTYRLEDAQQKLGEEAVPSKQEIYRINLSELLKHLETSKEKVVAMTVIGDRLHYILGTHNHSMKIAVADMKRRSRVPKIQATAKVEIMKEDFCDALTDVKMGVGPMRTVFELKDGVLHLIPDENKNISADIEVETKSIEGANARAKFGIDFVLDGCRRFPSEEMVIEMGTDKPIRLSSVLDFAQFTYIVAPVLE